MPLSPNYAVQMGAFKSKEKAHAYRLALQKKFPVMTFELLVFEGWWKVRAIHFSSRESAAKALVNLGGKGFIVHAKPDN